MIIDTKTEFEEYYKSSHHPAIKKLGVVEMDGKDYHGGELFEELAELATKTSKLSIERELKERGVEPHKRKKILDLYIGR